MHRIKTTRWNALVGLTASIILRPFNLLKGMTYVLAVLALVSCASNTSEPNELLGRWKMEAIQYDDGSQKTLGGENAIVFESTDVIEEIEGFGKRRYPYQRDGNTLTLVSGGEKVNWLIIQQQPNNMTISTPIGTYIISR